MAAAAPAHTALQHVQPAVTGGGHNAGQPRSKPPHTCAPPTYTTTTHPRTHPRKPSHTTSPTHQPTPATWQPARRAQAAAGALLEAEVVDPESTPAPCQPAHPHANLRAHPSPQAAAAALLERLLEAEMVDPESLLNPSRRLERRQWGVSRGGAGSGAGPGRSGWAAKWCWGRAATERAHSVASCGRAACSGGEVLAALGPCRVRLCFEALGICYSCRSPWPHAISLSHRRPGRCVIPPCPCTPSPAHPHAHTPAPFTHPHPPTTPTAARSRRPSRGWASGALRRRAACGGTPCPCLCAAGSWCRTRAASCCARPSRCQRGGRTTPAINTRSMRTCSRWRRGRARGGRGGGSGTSGRSRSTRRRCRRAEAAAPGAAPPGAGAARGGAVCQRRRSGSSTRSIRSSTRRRCSMPPGMSHPTRTMMSRATGRRQQGYCPAPPRPAAAGRRAAAGAAARAGRASAAAAQRARARRTRPRRRRRRGKALTLVLGADSSAAAAAHRAASVRLTAGRTGRRYPHPHSSSSNRRCGTVVASLCSTHRPHHRSQHRRGSRRSSKRRWHREGRSSTRTLLLLPAKLAALCSSRCHPELLPSSVLTPLGASSLRRRRRLCCLCSERSRRAASSAAKGGRQSRRMWRWQGRAPGRTVPQQLRKVQPRRRPGGRRRPVSPPRKQRTTDPRLLQSSRPRAAGSAAASSSSSRQRRRPQRPQTARWPPSSKAGQRLSRQPRFGWRRHRGSSAGRCRA